MRIVRLTAFLVLAATVLAGIATTPAGRQGSTPASAADPTAARKGSVTLTLLQQNGQPWAGATVSYAQTSHDFLFGFGNMGGPWGAGPLWLIEQLSQAGLNYTFPNLQWGLTEPQPGTYDFNLVDSLFMPDALKALGLTTHAHCLLWLNPQFQGIPDYVQSLSFEELKQRTQQHVFDVVSRYKGTIDYWPIIEPLFSNAAGLTENEWVGLVGTTVDAIRKADPDAKVMIFLWPTDVDAASYYHNWPNAPAGIQYSPRRFLQDLVNNGVDFDVIALELYPIGWWLPLDDRGYPDVAWFSDLLDSYAAFGKPIFLPEVSVPDSTNGLGPDWKCCSGASPEAQAQWLRELFVMAFDKPFVHALGWFFVTDTPTSGFLPPGGLMHQDYTPKPSYAVLKDLIASWTTRGGGVTDDNGVIRITGYAGDYTLTVSDGGRTESFVVHISEGGADSVVLAPAPRGPSTPIIWQELRSDRTADAERVTFLWQPSGDGPQWLDLSIGDSGFAPGTFLSTGPLPPEAWAFSWDGLRPGLRHYVRVNTLTSQGWSPSPALVFTTGRWNERPASPRPRIIQECSQRYAGKVEVTLSWVPAYPAGSSQWVDLSVFDNGFSPGTLLAVGPLRGGLDSYTWDGVAPGLTHYWRVNTAVQAGWRGSNTGRFTTLACPP